MKYGDKYQGVLIDRFTKKRIPYNATYKYAEWKDYHTNNGGDGLWRDNKQILGTCQFTVTGCKTEKAAKAKIKKYINEMEMVK